MLKLKFCFEFVNATAVLENHLMFILACSYNILYTHAGFDLHGDHPTAGQSKHAKFTRFIF